MIDHKKETFWNASMNQLNKQDAVKFEVGVWDTDCLTYCNKTKYWVPTYKYQIIGKMCRFYIKVDKRQTNSHVKSQRSKKWDKQSLGIQCLRI